VPLPHDPGPHWGEVGIHGLHRPREWDVVTMVDAPELEGDEAWFVTLESGKILLEAGDADVWRLAGAIATERPFRAHAVRRAGSLWAVAARRIETIDLVDDPGGDAIEVSWDGVERSVRIDGRPTLVGLPALERLGRARHATYVVTAARLAGATWEVAVAPL
jgi:hypothetical protein